MSELTREQQEFIDDLLPEQDEKQRLIELFTENAVLRARVAELEREVEGHAARINALRTHLSATIAERDQIFTMTQVLEARLKARPAETQP